MKIIIFRVVSVILLILLMTSVFFLSGQNSVESSELSGGFTYKLFSAVYPGFNNLQEWEKINIVQISSHYIRKLAHFSFYFLMGTLSFLSFVTYKQFSFNLRSIFSFAVCVCYSASDEIHQYFVPGRSCELRDVMIDSSGAFFAIALLFVLCTFVKRVKKLVY